MTFNNCREAPSIIDELIGQHAENHDYHVERAGLCCTLGDILSDQGQYLLAQAHYQEALSFSSLSAIPSIQAVALGQLGHLSLLQGDYTSARAFYRKALSHFRTLREPAKVAVVWHQLGRIAEEQEEWAEAERCYRKSLVLKEKLGKSREAAETYHQIAIVAAYAGHPDEAEGWFKRALQRIKMSEVGSVAYAFTLCSLANSLANEVAAKRSDHLRLAEARSYAEEALQLQEQPDASTEVWTTLHTLAKIADLEGQPEVAQDYRRREREAYTAFAGNRHIINQQHETLIAAVVAAIRGENDALTAVKAALPGLESAGWHISSALLRLLDGVRDWNSLVESLDGAEALLMLRILETLSEPFNQEEC